jgi:hypothetical protein
MMKAIFFAGILALSGAVVTAEESVSEKASAKAHDAKRAMKKGGHRVAEAVCMEGDAECLARKAKNRAVEAKDYTKDKAIEVKDKADADGNARD